MTRRARGNGEFIDRHEGKRRRPSGTRSTPFPGQDVLIQQREKSIPSSRRSAPPVASGVNSVYITRPVNAEDFVHSELVNIPNPGITFGANAFTVFSVPAGSVAVVKSFLIELRPFVATVDEDDVLLTISVGGVAQRGFTSLPISQDMGDYTPCHVMANEGQDIKFFLLFPNLLAFAEETPDRNAFFKLQGNLLQTRGLPLPEQISSHSGRKGTSLRDDFNEW